MSILLLFEKINDEKLLKIMKKAYIPLLKEN